MNMQRKIGGNAGACFMRDFISAKPDLYIVITIAQHDCDRVLKRVLKLSIYLLQIFLVKYEYLRSLQLCEDQGICGKLKRHVTKYVLATFTTYMETRLPGPGFKFDSCSKNVKQGRFQRFQSNDTMTDFFTQ